MGDVADLLGLSRRAFEQLRAEQRDRVALETARTFIEAVTDWSVDHPEDASAHGLLPGDQASVDRWLFFSEDASVIWVWDYFRGYRGSPYVALPSQVPFEFLNIAYIGGGAGWADDGHFDLCVVVKFPRIMPSVATNCAFWMSVYEEYLFHVLPPRFLYQSWVDGSSEASYELRTELDPAELRATERVIELVQRVMLAHDAIVRRVSQETKVTKFGDPDEVPEEIFIDPDSEEDIGMMQLSVEHDFLYWTRLRADAGDVEAMFDYSTLTEVDSPQRLAYLKSAADRGHIRAAYDYACDVGDKSQKREYLKRAADAGHVAAMFEYSEEASDESEKAAYIGRAMAAQERAPDEEVVPPDTGPDGSTGPDHTS